MHLTPSQLATTLAALRFWQKSGGGDVASHAFLPQEFLAIAEDGGAVIPLDDAGIDALCEALNTNSPTHPVKHMNTYTAFCQAATGHGTIWIGSLDAADCEMAGNQSLCQCAEDWSMDADQIHLLGIAAGDVEILLWQDIEE